MPPLPSDSCSHPTIDPKLPVNEAQYGSDGMDREPQVIGNAFIRKSEQRDNLALARCECGAGVDLVAGLILGFHNRAEQLFPSVTAAPPASAGRPPHKGIDGTPAAAACGVPPNLIVREADPARGADGSSRFGERCAFRPGNLLDRHAPGPAFHNVRLSRTEQQPNCACCCRENGVSFQLIGVTTILKGYAQASRPRLSKKALRAGSSLSFHKRTWFIRGFRERKLFLHLLCGHCRCGRSGFLQISFNVSNRLVYRGFVFPL